MSRVEEGEKVEPEHKKVCVNAYDGRRCDIWAQQSLKRFSTSTSNAL